MDNDNLEKIEKIIMAYEDDLSDGYMYYAPRLKEDRLQAVKRVVREIATDICLLFEKS